MDLCYDYSIVVRKVFSNDSNDVIVNSKSLLNPIFKWCVCVFNQNLHQTLGLWVRRAKLSRNLVVTPRTLWFYWKAPNIPQTLNNGCFLCYFRESFANGWYIWVDWVFLIKSWTHTQTLCFGCFIKYRPNNAYITLKYWTHTQTNGHIPMRGLL